MWVLLEEINRAVHDANGSLEKSIANQYRRRYRKLLREAEIECPPPDEQRENGKRGADQKKQSKKLARKVD